MRREFVQFVSAWGHETLGKCWGKDSHWNEA